MSPTSSRHTPEKVFSSGASAEAETGVEAAQADPDSPHFSRALWQYP